MISIYGPNDKHLHLTTNFRVEEFACACCQHAIVFVRLPALLEAVRRIVQKPVTITSGYRCPTHNKAVGGAPRSTHMGGMAADLTWEGFELTYDVKEAIRKIPGIQGMGWGSNFIHVDADISRVAPTEWTY